MVVVTHKSGDRGRSLYFRHFRGNVFLFAVPFAPQDLEYEVPSRELPSRLPPKRGEEASEKCKAKGLQK